MNQVKYYYKFTHDYDFSIEIETAENEKFHIIISIWMFKGINAIKEQLKYLLIDYTMDTYENKRVMTIIIDKSKIMTLSTILADFLIDIPDIERKVICEEFSATFPKAELYLPAPKSKEYEDLADDSFYKEVLSQKNLHHGLADIIISYTSQLLVKKILEALKYLIKSTFFLSTDMQKYFGMSAKRTDDIIYANIDGEEVKLPPLPDFKIGSYLKKNPEELKKILLLSPVWKLINKEVFLEKEFVKRRINYTWIRQLKKIHDSYIYDGI